MIRPIVAYGDPILKKKAIEIDIDEPGELKSLIKDLWDTCLLYTSPSPRD